MGRIVMFLLLALLLPGLASLLVVLGLSVGPVLLIVAIMAIVVLACRGR